MLYCSMLNFVFVFYLFSAVIPFLVRLFGGVLDCNDLDKVCAQSKFEHKYCVNSCRFDNTFLFVQCIEYRYMLVERLPSNISK